MGMALGASSRSASCASASPSPAAGVEDAQRLPVVVVVAGGGVNQLRDQVHHPIGRGVVAAFRLRCKSHVVLSFLSGVGVRSEPAGFGLAEVAVPPCPGGRHVVLDGQRGEYHLDAAGLAVVYLPGVDVLVRALPPGRTAPRSAGR